MLAQHAGQGHPLQGAAHAHWCLAALNPRLTATMLTAPRGQHMSAEITKRMWHLLRWLTRSPGSLARDSRYNTLDGTGLSASLLQSPGTGHRSYSGSPGAGRAHSGGEGPGSPRAEHDTHRAAATRSCPWLDWQAQCVLETQDSDRAGAQCRAVFTAGGTQFELGTGSANSSALLATSSLPHEAGAAASKAADVAFSQAQEKLQDVVLSALRYAAVAPAAPFAAAPAAVGSSSAAASKRTSPQRANRSASKKPESAKRGRGSHPKRVQLSTVPPSPEAAPAAHAITPDMLLAPLQRLSPVAQRSAKAWLGGYICTLCVQLSVASLSSAEGAQANSVSQVEAGWSGAERLALLWYRVGPPSAVPGVAAGNAGSPAARQVLALLHMVQASDSLALGTSIVSHAWQSIQVLLQHARPERAGPDASSMSTARLLVHAAHMAWLSAHVHTTAGWHGLGHAGVYAWCTWVAARVQACCSATELFALLFAHAQYVRAWLDSGVGSTPVPLAVHAACVSCVQLWYAMRARACAAVQDEDTAALHAPALLCLLLEHAVVDTLQARGWDLVAVARHGGGSSPVPGAGSPDEGMPSLLHRVLEQLAELDCEVISMGPLAAGLVHPALLQLHGALQWGPSWVTACSAGMPSRAPAPPAPRTQPMLQVEPGHDDSVPTLAVRRVVRSSAPAASHALLAEPFQRKLIGSLLQRYPWVSELLLAAIRVRFTKAVLRVVEEETPAHARQVRDMLLQVAPSVQALAGSDASTAVLKAQLRKAWDAAAGTAQRDVYAQVRQRVLRELPSDVLGVAESVLQGADIPGAVLCKVIAWLVREAVQDHQQWMYEAAAGALTRLAQADKPADVSVALAQCEASAATASES